MISIQEVACNADVVRSDVEVPSWLPGRNNQARDGKAAEMSEISNSVISAEISGLVWRI